MRKHTWAGAAVLLLCTAAALAGCGRDGAAGNEPGRAASEGSTTQESEPGGARADDRRIADPIVTTHRGGVSIIDGETFEVAAHIDLDGFLRVNPAGDDRHVLVSTAEGFQVLDAVAGELTGEVFEAKEAGHVVSHAGRTTLFADGTGEITTFAPNRLGNDGLPRTRSRTTEAPHHGVAVRLPDGTLVTSDGSEHETNAAVALEENGHEVARNEDCPGLHGGATAKGGAVVLGCEDGALIYDDGAFTKVDSPTAYGRIGNHAGFANSPVVLGDYKRDPDAELERPRAVSLIDTETHELELVELPATYSFRSLDRGPHGEALVLGSDGRIHVIDPHTAEITRSIPVLDEPWTEPKDWRKPRPDLFVRGETGYVSDPASGQLHAVDLEKGTVRDTVSLEHTPNELGGVLPG